MSGGLMRTVTFLDKMDQFGYVRSQVRQGLWSDTILPKCSNLPPSRPRARAKYALEGGSASRRLEFCIVVSVAYIELD